MTALTDHWPLVLVAALAAVVLLYLLLRPRQRVTLTDSAPVRPHMHGVDKTRVAPPPDTIPIAEPITPIAGDADDLTRLKGVGPRLAALLNENGMRRFDQIAKLTPTERDELDARLGSFGGRLARDHVVDQADYLARGDVAGFEQRFGKL